MVHSKIIFYLLLDGCSPKGHCFTYCAGPGTQLHRHEMAWSPWIFLSVWTACSHLKKFISLVAVHMRMPTCGYGTLTPSTPERHANTPTLTKNGQRTNSIICFTKQEQPCSNEQPTNNIITHPHQDLDLQDGSGNHLRVISLWYFDYRAWSSVDGWS